MGWVALDKFEFNTSLAKLQFDFRPAKSFRTSYDNIAHFEAEDLPTETNLDEWIIAERQNRIQHHSWPRWCSTILALSRGPMNEFERADQSAREQLQNVGYTRQQLLDLKQHFRISESFPSCILKDQSYYSQDLDSSTSSGELLFRYNLRSSQMTLGDLALTAVSCVSKGHTLTLITGFTNETLEKIELWMKTMKEYGGHPQFPAALFLELHFRRLGQRYRQLRVRYLSLWYETFGDENMSGVKETALRYRKLIENGSKLAEKSDTLHLETTMFGLRLSDVWKDIDVVASMHSNILPDHQWYLLKHGNLLRDHLKRLEQENVYLKEKSDILRNNAKSLISSVS